MEEKLINEIDDLIVLMKFRDCTVDNFIEKADWFLVSRYPALSTEFIREFKDNVYWNLISNCNSNLDETLLDEFEGKIRWEYAILNSNITLPDRYIRKYSGKLDWNKISEKTHTEEFLIKFQEYINWSRILDYGSFSENLIEKCQEYINWTEVSRKSFLSHSFVKKFQHKISWQALMNNSKFNFTKDFVIKFKYKLDTDIFIAQELVTKDDINSIPSILSPESKFDFLDI